MRRQSCTARAPSAGTAIHVLDFETPRANFTRGSYRCSGARAAQGHTGQTQQGHRPLWPPKAASRHRAAGCSLKPTCAGPAAGARPLCREQTDSSGARPVQPCCPGASDALPGSAWQACPACRLAVPACLSSPFPAGRQNGEGLANNLVAGAPSKRALPQCVHSAACSSLQTLTQPFLARCAGAPH